LAVTTDTRWSGLPNIPTVGEFVKGYEASAWFSVGTPRNTRTEIIDFLNSQINAALNEPKTTTRLTELGGTVLIGSPSDFGKLIAEARAERRHHLLKQVQPRCHSASREARHLPSAGRRAPAADTPVILGHGRPTGSDIGIGRERLEFL
jgi:hypothetical protein